MIPFVAENKHRVGDKISILQASTHTIHRGMYMYVHTCIVCILGGRSQIFINIRNIEPLA